MFSIADNLKTVRQRLQKATEAAARTQDPVAAEAVKLMAVSKTRSAWEVEALFALGVQDFGENYVQEGVEKVQALSHLPIEWHFIGPIQSNKTKAIAEHFSWVHSLDRAKIAQRLNDQRPPGLPPLNVCLQVNIDAEDTKSGVPPRDLSALAAAVTVLPRLRLRGLMCIPDPSRGDAALRQSFARMRELFHWLQSSCSQSNSDCPTPDTLSMGMSDDLELAIAEGSTCVRVGTALFGPRPTKPTT